MAKASKMSKSTVTAIGMDLGRYAWKAVALARRPGGVVEVTGAVTRRVEAPGGGGAEADLENLARLARAAGGRGRRCGVTVSGGDCFVTVIPLPAVGREALRAELGRRGSEILSRDCTNFVLDCDLARVGGAVRAGGPGLEQSGPGLELHVVAGVARSRARRLFEALRGMGWERPVLQAAPVALFNAFDAACEDVSSAGAALLLDIGHEESHVAVVCRREMVLARAVDFGGRALAEQVARAAETDAAAARALLLDGRAGVERLLAEPVGILAREVAACLAYFERHWGESIGRVFVSGGPAVSDVLLRALSNSFNLPCEVWNPFACCLVSAPQARGEAFLRELTSLHNAFGAGIAALAGAY